MYNTILFDLDGTLTDPGVGITNSVSYALKKFDIQITDRSELYQFIGPPLLDSFMDFYGFTKNDAKLAITYYREYYHDKGIFENIIYDGMEDLLQTLYDAHYKLLVATSKPEEFAIRILEYFHIKKYFTYIAGATMDGKVSAKKAVISYALSSGQVTDPACAIMIGDRKYDVLGAKQSGIDSMGVLYGYGNREELEAAGATYIVTQVTDIYPALKQSANEK